MSGRRGVEVLVNPGAHAGAPAELMERGVRAALDAAGVESGEVSVTLLDDGAIRELNLRWLGEDRPTDVLAFILAAPPTVLGDVYVGVDQARRQAADLGVSLAEELVRLAVHGALHVLGHDHPEGPERWECAMFALQEDLVRRAMEQAGSP